MNPLISYWIFGVFVVLLTLLVVWAYRGEKKEISSEKRVIQEGILKCLGLSPGSASHEKASERILALVPAQAKELYGYLSVLDENDRIWLCFLKGQMVAISSKSGEFVEMSLERLEKIYLKEETSGNHMIGISAAADEGTSLFEIERLDDLVRIVNVMSSNQIVMGYLR